MRIRVEPGRNKSVAENQLSNLAASYPDSVENHSGSHHNHGSSERISKSRNSAIPFQIYHDSIHLIRQTQNGGEIVGSVAKQDHDQLLETKAKAVVNLETYPSNKASRSSTSKRLNDMIE